MADQQDVSMWESIAARIGDATGEPFVPSQRDVVGGGCINSSFRLGDGHREFFVKLNQAHLEPMFCAEADGLAELAASESVRVPRAVCLGQVGEQAFLVLESLTLDGGGSMERFARELAQMHRYQAERFGWWRENTIGSTSQPNEQHADWVEFWRHQRLGYQLELAARNGFAHTLLRDGDRLLADVGAFFTDYTPVPSLLHGDLWGGNYGFTDAGEPVIFDPATYYGDREADLAMSELFGGFGGHFYAAYDEAWPRDPGYAVRRQLYNLYHILNHANMFGGSYAGQAQSMVGRLLAELG